MMTMAMAPMYAESSEAAEKPKTDSTAESPPGCHLIPVKVLDRRGNGYSSDVLTGLRWIRENKERWNIRIVNISVGSFSRRNMGENSALVRGVNAAWDDGLVVVVAAGNMGPKSGTITTPGISRKVITVGCSDDHKEVNVLGSRMIDYSGRGPTNACICKPDIVAPGASIVSCASQPGKYTSKSGTSMATPLVSGAIALLLEKHPEMSNRDVKLHLRDRAVDLGLPKISRDGDFWMWGDCWHKKIFIFNFNHQYSIKQGADTPP